jgi:hypothetical protein
LVISAGTKCNDCAAQLRPVGSCAALLAECDEEWMTGKIYLNLKA